MIGLNDSWRIAAAATLLACTGCRTSGSGSELVCSTLETGGGIISSHDSVLSLSFRPGSLSEDTEVCISPAERPPNGPPFVYGEAYRVTPDIDLGVNLSVTYRFELPDDTSQTAIGVIRRADFEAGDGRWLSLPITRLEPDNKLVAGTDSRLSMFYGLLDDGGSGVVDPTVASTEGTSTTDPSTSGDPTTDTTTDATESETDTNNIDTDGSDTDADTDSASASESESDSESDSDSDSTTGTSGGSSSTGSDTSETGVVKVDCDNLMAPPFDITQIATVTAGSSEDLAMTGQGTFVLADGGDLIEMDGDGNSEVWYAGLPYNTDILGMRFDPYGTLHAAMGFNADEVWSFTEAGGEVLIATGGDTPNGIHVDSSGNVWVTHILSNTIDRIDPTGPTIETLVAGEAQANGLFYDENREVLYWVRYGSSQLWRAPVAGGVIGVPIPTVDLDGFSDGLSMDECGNLYVVDQGGVDGGPCRIDRIPLDAAGAPDGGPLDSTVVEIAGAGDLGNSCANAQFGYGFGDEYDQALFVTGQTGAVYRVQVGVGGYDIPLPPG
ncbi:MAG: hypothetical protein AAGA54_11835 [Myxococcota bacterium]